MAQAWFLTSSSPGLGKALSVAVTVRVAPGESMMAAKFGAEDILVVPRERLPG